MEPANSTTEGREHSSPASLDAFRFWKDRPTLVTGGTGFLGTCLTRKLVALGANVMCLVRDWVPQSELVRTKTVERVRILRGDVRDRDCVERILSEYQVNTVFHLAAQAIVGVANRNPLETLETNVGGTWRVLEACRRTPTVKQIVLASSDKAYGVQPNLPLTERMPLAGAHPYDASKSCADLLARSYASTYGLPVAITRCANLFGGGDLNFNRIVPGTIRHILQDQRPVIRSDGKFIRDYLYVEDAAEAHLVLARQLATRSELAGQAFNFSNELRISAIDLVQRLLSMMGSNLEPIILNEAANEIRESYLSARLAYEVLGWRPLISHAEALGRTIDWYRDFHESERASSNTIRPSRGPQSSHRHADPSEPRRDGSPVERRGYPAYSRRRRPDEGWSCRTDRVPGKR